MRVRIRRMNEESINNNLITDSDIDCKHSDTKDKILISRSALDRLLLETIEVLIEDYLQEVSDKVLEETAEQACSRRGFYSLLRWLRITNALSKAMKAKL